MFVQLSCLLLSFIAALSSQEAVCYFISSATVRSNKFIVFSLLSVAWLLFRGQKYPTRSSFVIYFTPQCNHTVISLTRTHMFVNQGMCLIKLISVLRRVEEVIACKVGSLPARNTEVCDWQDRCFHVDSFLRHCTPTVVSLCCHYL